MKVKNEFYKWGSFRLKNDCQIGFWKDTWLNNRLLYEQYPSSYNNVRRKQDIVAEVMRSIPLRVCLVWLLAVALPPSPSQKPTKGVGCPQKPQPKVVFLEFDLHSSPPPASLSCEG
jgi:hypothetical protein